MKNRLKALVRQILLRLGLLSDQLRNQRVISKYRKAILAKSVKREVSVWVIGCGRMGKQFVGAIKGIEGFEVKGLVDRNTAAAEALVALFRMANTSVYSNTTEILPSFNRKHDILVIATTANSHYTIAKWAIESGIKKIVLEKPLACSLAEGQGIQNLSSQTNSLIYVDHTRRWMRCYQGLRLLLSRKIIGEVERIYLPFGEGGIAMIGSHYFDLVRYLFQEDFVAVQGRLDETQMSNQRGNDFTDPSGSFWLKMESGIEATIDLSNSMQRRHNFMLFLGTKGRIEVDVSSEQIFVFTDSGRHFIESFPYGIDKKDALAELLINLAQGKPAECSVFDGYKALEAVIGSLVSAENNSSIMSFPLEGPVLDRSFSFA